MWFPTVTDILLIHKAVVDAAPPDVGRHSGVRHLGSVEAAVERAQWGPFEVGDLAERAALLLRGIAEDHPFEDGNKRTAFVVARVFIVRNGNDLVATDAEVVDLMFAVARGMMAREDIARWLRDHLRNR